MRFSKSAFTYPVLFLKTKKRYLGIGTQSFWSNFNTFFRPSLSDPYWSTKHLPSTKASYLASRRLLRSTHISTWVRENCCSDVRIFAIHTVSRRIKIWNITHHSGKWNDFPAAAAPVYTLPPLSPDWSLNILQWNFHQIFLASSPWKSGECYEGFVELKILYNFAHGTLTLTCTLREKKSSWILIGQQKCTNEISSRFFWLPVRERVWDATRVFVELKILFKFAHGTLMLTCTLREKKSSWILIGQQKCTNEISSRFFWLPVRERVWDATRVL